MSVKLDSRNYTNAMLTLIAVFLCALTIHAYRLSFVSGAQAQPGSSIRTAREGFSQGGVQAPDSPNARTQNDLAVAAATDHVAEANKEIANALRDVAKNIDSSGNNIAGAIRQAAGAMGSAGAPSAPRASTGEAPTVSVGR